MRRPVLVIVATMLASAALLAHEPAAWACSCVASPTKTLMKRADLVFVGTASAVDAGTDGPVDVTFQVTEVYKGMLDRSAVVRTAGDEAACGVEFVAGQRYAVFASISGSVVETDLCSGTTDDHAAFARDAGRPAVVYPAFGPATTAVSAPPARARTSDVRTGLIAAAALLLAAVGTVGSASVWRRRRAGDLV